MTALGSRAERRHEMRLSIIRDHERRKLRIDDVLELCDAYESELSAVKEELADTKADYLRRHKDACDCWLQVAQLRPVVEFGRYLAAAAEQYVDCMNSAQVSNDEMADKYQGVRSAIYEFRKRLPQPVNQGDVK